MIFALMIYLSTMHPADAAQLISLDASVCQAMVAHMPDDDVAYKPGVDVNGKPVVEADLNASPVQVPEIVTFDITVDMAKQAGIVVPEGVEGQGKIGTVTINKDGHMTFDDKPMEGESEAALRSLCTEKDTLQKPKKIIYNQ